MDKEAERYNPLNHSVVQACVGSWESFACDDFIEALLAYILKEIARVHWNIYQHEWKPTWHGDGVEDPEIPGISFVRFYQDRCDCGGNGDRDCLPTCISQQPNFQHEDVIFRWYKWPGRGMSTNKSWSADEWKSWFERCLATVRAFEGTDYHSQEEQQRKEHLRAEFEKKYEAELKRGW